MKSVSRKVQAQFDTDQPMVPLYYTPNLYSYSSKVQNFRPFITGNYNLRNVWLIKKLGRYKRNLDAVSMAIFL